MCIRIHIRISEHFWKSPPLSLLSTSVWNRVVRSFEISFLKTGAPGKTEHMVKKNRYMTVQRKMRRSKRGQIWKWSGMPSEWTMGMTLYSSLNWLVAIGEGMVPCSTSLSYITEMGSHYKQLYLLPTREMKAVHLLHMPMHRCDENLFYAAFSRLTTQISMHIFSSFVRKVLFKFLSLRHFDVIFSASTSHSNLRCYQKILVDATIRDIP